LYIQTDVKATFLSSDNAFKTIPSNHFSHHLSLLIHVNGVLLAPFFSQILHTMYMYRYSSLVPYSGLVLRKGFTTGFVC